MKSNTQKNYNLFLGLNDKDAKIQLIDNTQAVVMVNNLLLKKYNLPAFTFQEARGVYTHEDGSIVIENTLQIIIKLIDDETIKKIVEELKIIFNQESVLIEEVISIITFA